MAYNTPTSYNGSMGNNVRVISPSNVSSPNSNYVTAKIYRGFSSNNPNARNGVLYDADLIKQDIYNHFMTARGERVMMPKFGSIIWDYLYEPLDETTKSIIEEDAREIVSQDPRVQLQDVRVIGFENGIQLDVTLFLLEQNMVEKMTIEFNVNQSMGSSGSGSGGSSGGGSGSGGGGGY
jgi:phage baseplate assembly protein W